MTLNPGDTVGPYEVRERLGEGGMATVYRAWHGGLHRDEALKVPLGGNSDSAYVQRLLAEARMAAGLRHANVVAIHSVSEPGAPLPYFAMEWIEGEDLSAWLKERGRLDLEETVRLLEPVAAALDYAHSRGIIHRDIKPANILLQQEESRAPLPKVVDFGISRAAGEDDGATRLTRGGMFVGTPEYMSPEQSGSGDEVGPATDLYSLGVVAYELLTGKPPFTVGSGVSRLAILVAHVRETPVAPSEKVPGLPQLADEAILKALAKHPEDRFADCVAFIQALGEAIGTPAGVPAVALTVVAPDIPAPEQFFEDGATLMERPLPTRASGAATKDMPAPALTRAEDPARTMTGPTPPLVTQIDSIPSPAKRISVPILSGLGGLLAGAVLMLAWAIRSPAPQQPAIPKKPVTQPAASLPKVRIPPKAPTLPIREEKVRRVRPIAFTTEYRSSPYLRAGSKKTVRYGRSGQREVVLGLKWQGQKQVSRKVLTTKVLRAPQSQVVLTGTKSAPKPVVRRAAAPQPVYRPAPQPQRNNYRPAPRPVYRPAPQKPRRPNPPRRQNREDLPGALRRLEEFRNLRRDIERNLQRGVPGIDHLGH